jgi:hypothetical protein
MDLRAALKQQYHGGLKMLAQCVEECPDDLWTHVLCNEKDDEGRLCIRSFWRIAGHAAYFTHLYMGQGEEAFQAWPDRRKDDDQSGMWQKPWKLEFFEFPENTDVWSKQEMLGYISYIEGIVDETVDGLDLDTADSGFGWYKKTEKLSHELMNLRHIQGHVGQLSELLMQRGIDTNWVSGS